MRILIGILLALLLTHLVHADQQRSADVSSELYMGEITFSAANICPPDTLPFSGGTVRPTDFPGLFTEIADLYGSSDDQDKFGLPPLQGLSLIHEGQGSGLSKYELGDTNYPGKMADVSIGEHNHILRRSITADGKVWDSSSSNMFASNSNIRLASKSPPDPAEGFHTNAVIPTSPNPNRSAEILSPMLVVRPCIAFKGVSVKKGDIIPEKVDLSKRSNSIDSAPN